jgi:23S rRNA (adenine2503-C2)-methyltransferase
MTNTFSLLSLTHQEFIEKITQILGKGSVHAGLIYEEFFRQGTITGAQPAFNNAKVLFQEIFQHIDFKMPEIVLEKSDGNTGKFLLRTHDQLEVESVLIPMQAGGTLCISSQVGCRMGCTFCETGRMGLLRNLTVEEIVSQIFIARHILGFNMRNVVFMGMGEPFDNYDAVLQAVKVLMDPKGLAFGRSHITISTSGCVDGIDRLVDEGEYGPNLAVSVNAPEDAVRNKLMPINRKHNMQQLYQSMDNYCKKTGREILIAYVLLKGQNDTLEHADRLADYLRGLNVKINLIPYNPQSRDRFQPPEPEVLEAVTQRLRGHGYYTLLRLTKGSKIMAACGQLGNLELRKKRSNSFHIN